jgi:hypothetical protein
MENCGHLKNPAIHELAEVAFYPPERKLVQQFLYYKPFQSCKDGMIKFEVHTCTFIII